MSASDIFLYIYRYIYIQSYVLIILHQISWSFNIELIVNKIAYGFNFFKDNTIEFDENISMYFPYFLSTLNAYNF